MAKFFAWFSKRNKAVAAWVGANLTWCQLIAAQDGGFTKITAVEWVALAIANATALGVYSATNNPAASENLDGGAPIFMTNIANVPDTPHATTLPEPLAPEDHAQ